MGSLVREGLSAFAVRISARTAASGFILPNDRVDIISTVRVKLQSDSDEDDREIVFSRTIIANVRVLSINQSLAPDGPSVSEPETAVLELDPQQAEIVARSEAQGELSLALRSVSEAGGGTADDRPVIAALPEIPNSVEMYKQGIRFLMSCEPRCDPVLQMVNVPFPLVVRDVGIETPAQKK
jgi:pilus assembly protein CpaB